ncbi:putative gustatory receptor 28b [Toxorhynchites rutilus septentrionalis]|uniref:putative gustatory receptor 28b n=1 Tax=Toxorhynchites rutilus septentrionalis TaxID=329112 RepID=UPI00247A8E47|nr:putative gustatory receptor 28b [Toxorhynchites rutilus septentrionalis]
MKWCPEDNFFESWRFVYWITKVFAITTYTVNFEDQTAEQTSTDQLVMIASLLVCLLSMYNSYESYKIWMNWMTTSYISNIGLFATQGFLQLSQLISLILNYINAMKVFKIATIMNKVDKKFFVLFGYRMTYHRRHLYGALLAVSGYINWIIYMIVMTHYFNPLNSGLTLIELLRIGLSSFWVVLCFQTNGIYIVLILLTLRTHFAQLNKQIRKHFNTTPHGKLRYTMDSDQASKLIMKFATLHDQLSDAIGLFNQCFSTQAMFGLTLAFGFTVFSIFGVIHTHATDTDENSRQLSRFNMIYDGFYVLFIVQLVVFSSLVNTECKRTATVIHKVICYGSHDKQTLKELRIFSQQLWHHTPKISCGLFAFEWELFYTMAGSLTTYLIILMQFDLVNFDYAVLVAGGD